MEHFDLIIIGAGAVGGHIAANLHSYGLQNKKTAILDDDKRKHNSYIFGIPVIGSIERAFDYKNTDIVLGISFPEVKRTLIKKLETSDNFTFPTLISDKAWVSKGVSFGKGSIIYPGTSINYGTSIADFVVINMNCALGHNCSIGEYSALAPGVNLGGYTNIESGVDIGIGASTIQNITIGKNSTVGGQCMVVSDFPESSKIVGVPGHNI